MGEGFSASESGGGWVRNLIHPRVLNRPIVIDRLLSGLCDSGRPLFLSVPRLAAEQEVRVVEARRGLLQLAARDPRVSPQDEISLRFELDGHPHSFSAEFLEYDAGVLSVCFPRLIYKAERRDRPRASLPAGAADRVLLRSGRASFVGDVIDRSADGMAVGVSGDAAPAEGDQLELSPATGAVTHGKRVEVVSVRRTPGSHSWVRLGLTSVGPVGTGLLPIDRRPRPVAGELREPGADWQTDSRLVQYANERGEEIAAVVDSWGSSEDGPVVVIPPAWGRTKETLIALSETMVSVFRASGSPISVIRFDGTHRKGASYRDAEAEGRGRENLRYTFSQGIRDLKATLEYAEAELNPRAGSCVIVSFSIASLEARRAIVVDQGRRVGGWVSVVGASDPQSLLRVLSGGVDYLASVDRGESMGEQGVQGLVLDVDRASLDALANRLAYLEDACRDMQEVTIPVTWMHGRDDGWNQLSRVRKLLSAGDIANRRLLEIPTGHELRDSKEAAEIFQQIAAEVGEMALNRTPVGCAIDAKKVIRRRREERSSSQPAAANLRRFWRDYLVGRRGELGMELATAMSAYEGLMTTQLSALRLRPGQRVVDLGAGMGALPLSLASAPPEERPGSVVEVDFVAEGLQRARSRLRGSTTGETSFTTGFAIANLDLDGDCPAVPLASGVADAVLASLVINYLADPERLLIECMRILRPGGRLVVSTMRRDADVSQICLAGMSELRRGRGRRFLAPGSGDHIDASLNEFISNAGGLLDLEADGFFHFRDGAEIADSMARVGFEAVTVGSAYGEPPQAAVVCAARPMR
jgi:ubiquinone/menaquinone biosynthesis C-methylase UbiE